MCAEEHRLEIDLLGKCEIRVNGRVPSRALSQGACGILTLLIMHRKRSLTRAMIGQTLWDPTQVADYDANFRQGLRGLRQVLAEEGERLHEDREGAVKYLKLALHNTAIDVVRFEEAYRSALQTNSLPDWEKVLQLYGGVLLPGHEASWVLPLRADLQNAWLDALEKGADAALTKNILPQAHNLLQTILQTDPCHEHAAQRLMILLGEQRRIQEASEIYFALRRSLHDYNRGLPGSETAALHERLQRLQGASRMAPSLPKPSNNVASSPRLRKLPAPVNALIGRTNEVSRIARMLAISRCVTLSGAGGVGKTRLALEVAWQEETGFRDGAAFIDFSNLLPGVSDMQVYRMVVETLGIREVANPPLQELLPQEIGDRHLLLIFDNCEHILKVCTPLVERLLSACPALHILTTSREPLQARGERCVRTPSLAYPVHETPYSPRDLMRYSSVQLFLDRISLPDFTLTEAEVAPISWLCRALDGIPLALELAASQLDYFGTIENLNARISRSFWFLREASREEIPERYRVLRETIAWSYNLLPPEEQRMFRALATLWGGGTSGAISAIASSSDDPPLSQTLHRKSLLGLAAASEEESPDPTPRYRFTEPIRQFALEQLMQAGEQEEALQRHTDFFVQYVEQAEEYLQGADPQIGVRRLEADRENWRAAMRWTLQRTQKEQALRLGAALWRYWSLRGLHQEGDEFLQEALLLPGEVSPELLLRALVGAGNISYLCADYERTRRYFLQGREISHTQGNAFFEACSLVGLANASIGEQDFAESSRLLLIAIEYFEAAEDRDRAAIVYGNLANISNSQGDRLSALHYHRRSIDLWRKLPDRQNLALALNNLFHTLLHHPMPPELPDLLSEALTISLELTSPRLFAHTLFNTLSLAVEGRHYEQAASLIGANEVYRERVNLPLPTSAIANYTHIQENIRAKLGANTFEMSVMQGKRWNDSEITLHLREILSLPLPIE